MTQKIIDNLPEPLQQEIEYMDEESVGDEKTNNITLQDVEDITTDDYPDAAVENARMALDAK